MIAFIISNQETYKHFRIYSSTSNKWYSVCFLDGEPLCQCATIYKRNIKTICKHIKFIIDNNKLL